MWTPQDIDRWTPKQRNRFMPLGCIYTVQMGNGISLVFMRHEDDTWTARGSVSGGASRNAWQMDTASQSSDGVQRTH